jgi:hypothetical protein
MEADPDPGVNDPNLKTWTLTRFSVLILYGPLPADNGPDYSMFWTRVTFAQTQSPTLMTFNFTRR